MAVVYLVRPLTPAARPGKCGTGAVWALSVAAEATGGSTGAAAVEKGGATVAAGPVG